MHLVQYFIDSNNASSQNYKNKHGINMQLMFHNIQLYIIYVHEKSLW